MTEPQNIQVEDQSIDVSSSTKIVSFNPQTTKQGTISATKNNLKIQSKYCDNLAGAGSADNCSKEDDLPDKLPVRSLYKVCLPDHTNSIKSKEKVSKKKNVKIKDKKKVERGELDVIFERIREKKKLQYKKSGQNHSSEKNETEEIKIEDIEEKKASGELEDKENKTPDQKVNIAKDKKKIQSSMSKMGQSRKKMSN